MIEGLQHLLSPELLMWMIIAIIFAEIVAILPGLGGTFAIVLILPLAYQLDIYAALAVLIAMLAVGGTGNTMTSVFFGVPGSPSGVITMLDGYPMAKRGQAVRAISAGLATSVIGGIIGAITLALAIPLVKPIVLALGPPEYFMLILMALVLMSSISDGDTVKSLIAGFMGLMLSFVGLEMSTGTPRWVFDSLYLSGGLALVAVFIGMFAFSEMIEMLTQGGSVAKRTTKTVSSGRQMLQGIRDSWTYKKTVFQSSMIGLLFGFTPGLGGSPATFMAYAQAVKSSKNPEKFGKGTVQGVIAADAANNSNDGAALIPTLGFGIPGSPMLAIVISLMISVGIQPGPSMLTENVDIIWLLIYVLVLANVLGALFCFAVLPLMARMTTMNVGGITAPIIVLGFLGAYSATGELGDIWVALALAVVALVMMRHGYSRITFIVGFVLGSELERYYLLSMRVYGWGFLTHPIVVLLMAITIFSLFGPTIRTFIRNRRRVRISS